MHLTPWPCIVIEKWYVSWRWKYFIIFNPLCTFKVIEDILKLKPHMYRTARCLTYKLHYLFIAYPFFSGICTIQWTRNTRRLITVMSISDTTTTKERLHKDDGERSQSAAIWGHSGMYTTYFILRNSVYMMASLYKVICVQNRWKTQKLMTGWWVRLQYYSVQYYSIQWYVTSFFYILWYRNWYC